MKKRYEIEVDGLPSEIAIVPSSMGLGRPKLYYRDECVPRAGRKGSAERYRLVTDAGREEELLIRQDMTGAPILIFRDRKYPLERPLLWREWVLCLLPLAVAMPFALRYGAIGGALGGFIVVWSMITCANLLRGQKNIWLKIGCSIVNAGISILLIFVIIRIVVRLLAR